MQKSKTFYYDSANGQRVSKSTWKRSKSHGGTRYKRSYKKRRKIVRKPNREYLLFIFGEAEEKGKPYLSELPESKWSPITEASDETEEMFPKSQHPRILTIYKRKATNRTIINFTIHYIFEHLPEWGFIANELSGRFGEISVARGATTKEPWQVKLGRA